MFSGGPSFSIYLNLERDLLRLLDSSEDEVIFPEKILLLHWSSNFAEKRLSR